MEGAGAGVSGSGRRFSFGQATFHESELYEQVEGAMDQENEQFRP